MPFISIRLAAAVSLTASALFATPLAAAQSPPIKPGLWEFRSEGQDDQKRAQAAERMKNLPPEARAKLEAMMKERGIDMTASGATRVCFSKENMDVAQWANASSNCKTEFGSRSGSTWKWHSVCAQPALVSDGEAIFTNDENYTINSSTKLTLNGQEKTSQRTMKAKWVGSNCGDLKPFGPPR